MLATLSATRCRLVLVPKPLTCRWWDSSIGGRVQTSQRDQFARRSQMLKRGRILTEEEARATVRLWNNKAIHREAEEKRSRCPAVASDNGITTVGDGVKRL